MVTNKEKVDQIILIYVLKLIATRQVLHTIPTKQILINVPSILENEH